MSIKIDLIFTNAANNHTMECKDTVCGVRDKGGNRPIQMRIHRAKDQIIPDELIRECAYACSKDSPYKNELVVVI